MSLFWIFFLINLINSEISSNNDISQEQSSIKKKRKPPTELEIGVLYNTTCDHPVKDYDEVEVYLLNYFNSIFHFLIMCISI